MDDPTQHDEEQLGEETMVNAQLRKHMRATTESKVESEKLRELRSQDQQRLAVVEATLGEKESELMELRHRVDLFERGLYGMKEAMSEVTDLKLQRSIRDRNIGELTEAVNEHARAVQDLLEENVAMREKLGLPAETIAIDLTKIHHKRSLEYEQSKAMNIAYRKEIDRLEEERLQLKSQLRLQAMEKGERAVHLGLAAEDLMAVEEFAERLRYKGASDAVVMTSKNGKSIADSEQLNKLIANLDNVHQELRASRDDRVGLELEVRTLLQENQSLQAALKEVAETFVAGKPVRDDVSSATADPQLEQVQRLLVKLDNKSATQSVVTDRPTVAGESMVKVNAMLRHEITTLREKLHAQSGAVKTMEANVAQLQKELAEAQVTMPAEAITTTAPRVPIEQLIAEHGDLVPLTEQLVCALDELAVKTAELADAHAQLADFEMRLEVAVERQHQLHSASHRQEEQWAAEMNQLREAKTELELKCAEGEQRTAELEQLVDTQRALQSGDLDAEVVQQRLTDLTRRNIVLKVNEKALTRRYKALCESESHLRTQLEEARAELSRAEATATQTITRIRGQLQAQQLALATTRTTIENSVAKDDYDVLEAKFDTLNQKYQHALELSVEGVPTSLECLELREAASRSQLRIQELESQVATLEMAKSTLEGALGVHHDVDATTVGDATSPLLTKEYVKSLLTKTSKLTVGMDAAAMRAQFLESKCMAMEESESLLRTHLRETESKLMCAQTELLAQRETEGQLRLALTGSISRSEADSYRAEADKLNAEVVALRSEVDLYRELAATATRQVEDLRAMRAEHQKENEVLRAAMQEMQMQGDEKLVIGKLHQHIFALQVGEGTAARALEKEIDRNRKLELMLATTEKTAIDREKLLWNVRLEYKAKNHQIQKRFLQWKELYVTPPSVTTETPNGASSGRVTLTYYERLSAATQTLQSKYLELLQRTNQLQEERKTAVNENIRLISENEAKDEVIGALRVEVTGSGGQAILTQRMASWQQKLAELRAREMAQQREIIEKQEHISQLEALNREFMERAQSLEKKLLVEQVCTGRLDS